MVIPSSYLVTNAADKEDLIEEYKEVLSNIHCRQFNRGDGECGFKDSCMYKHETRDGKLFEYGWVNNKFIDGEWVPDTEQTLADRFDTHFWFRNDNNNKD